MSAVLCFVTGISAVGALFGFICRLDPLNWRTHQSSVVAMHMGLALGVSWALNNVSHGHVSPGDIGAVVAACCWLWVSLDTWASGPPEHTRRQIAQPENPPIWGR